MKILNQRISNIPSSVAFALNEKAGALQANGHDIIFLNSYDSDFKTPAHITEAAFKAIQNGATHYPAPIKGIPSLLEAIADKMARDNDIQVDPNREIVVTPSGQWGVFLALSAILNPGEEVLYLEPSRDFYPSMITFSGGVPVPVSLSFEDNFVVTADLLKAKLTSKTKALIINSPCVPTGRIFTRQELETIIDIVSKADLYLISDEIYEKLVFDNRIHLSIGSLPSMAERTLTVNGLSKAYAMGGWRLGWLVGPAPIVSAAIKLNSQTVTSAATFTMHAAVAALNGPQDIVDEIRESFQIRRDFILKKFNEVEGIECVIPEGTFFLLSRFPNSQKNSIELTNVLLEEAGVLGIPGITFGVSGEGHICFSITASMPKLEKATEFLARTIPIL